MSDQADAGGDTCAGGVDSVGSASSGSGATKGNLTIRTSCLFRQVTRLCRMAIWSAWHLGGPAARPNSIAAIAPRRPRSWSASGKEILCGS